MFTVKKIIAISLFLVMSLGLVACTNNNGNIIKKPVRPKYENVQKSISLAHDEYNSGFNSGKGELSGSGIRSGDFIKSHVICGCLPSEKMEYNHVNLLKIPAMPHKASMTALNA